MSSLSPPGEQRAVSDHDCYEITLSKTDPLGVNLKFSVPLSCEGLQPKEEMSSTCRLICLLARVLKKLRVSKRLVSNLQTAERVCRPLHQLLLRSCTEI